MATNPTATSLYAALEALPEHLTGEIVDGQLHATPRPAPPHSLVASVLGADLLQPFHRGRGGPGGWWILDEPEVHFVTKVELAVPDIAGWRRERLPAMPPSAFFELVPDWLCEILSPSTARYDRYTKLPAYERHGVPFVWLVDPVERWLEVHTLENGRYTCEGRIDGDGSIRQPPFAEWRRPQSSSQGGADRKSTRLNSSHT